MRWTDQCRFELVVFSTLPPHSELHEPFTFTHRERVNAPGTLLAESLIDPHLRAWDFASGAAFRSEQPIVFSFSTDPRSKRDFMNISTSSLGSRQQFDAPGEGGILGMGNNAIVHHVGLNVAGIGPLWESGLTDGSSHGGPGPWPLPPGPSSNGSQPLQLSRRDSTSPPFRRASSIPSSLAELGWSSLTADGGPPQTVWDAAVKRPFSLPKMLASIANKAEAGVAKRLRKFGALNRQVRQRVSQSARCRQVSQECVATSDCASLVRSTGR